MTRFDPKGKYTIQGRPIMKELQLSSLVKRINQKETAGVQDLFDILYMIPGMKEHDERFRRRAAALQYRLEMMHMNHEDAKQLAWLQTFHDFEDGTAERTV